MPPQIALALCVVFILYLFMTDAEDKCSPALWIPLIWMLIIGSRPVTLWLYAGAGAYASPEQYLAGSPIDRNIYLFLIVAGLLVLSRRKLAWGWVFRSNRWIVLFFLYAAVSVLWSDFPFVSFKRWVKSSGHLVMALVILSERDPVEATKTVIRRCSYVLIPLSIVLIKYYPQLGRSYSPWTGEAYNCGVSYNKNGLGYLCLVSGVFFFWELITTWRRKDELWGKLKIIAALAMVLWLLLKADSATSFGCLVVGVCVLLGLSLIKGNIRYLGIYVAIVVLLFLAVHLLGPDLYVLATSSLGRDTTLTGRTILWGKVISMVKEPLIGTGYESFWLGERAEKLWNMYWWHPNQAHNGYIEIYLNLGLTGLFLLGGTIVSSYARVRETLLSGFDYGRFRMACLVIVLLYNVTEAAFKGLHLVFFLFILTVTDLPRSPRLKQGR